MQDITDYKLVTLVAVWGAKATINLQGDVTLDNSTCNLSSDIKAFRKAYKGIKALNHKLYTKGLTEKQMMYVMGVEE